MYGNYGIIFGFYNAFSTNLTWYHYLIAVNFKSGTWIARLYSCDHVFRSKRRQCQFSEVLIQKCSAQESNVGKVQNGTELILVAETKELYRITSFDTVDLCYCVGTWILIYFQWITNFPYRIVRLLAGNAYKVEFFRAKGINCVAQMRGAFSTLSVIKMHFKHVESAGSRI